MFNETIAIASLANNRSKKDEETARDNQREQVYASMNDIQSRVDSCQLSPADGVAQANEIVREYYEFCDTFKNGSVAQSCRNYETQDYPGGPQQGAFNTRRQRIAAGGGNCRQSPVAAPVVDPIAAPVVVPVAVPIASPSGPQSGGGCCGYVPGGGAGAINIDGNVGFNWGGIGGGRRTSGGFFGGGGAGNGGGSNGGGLAVARARQAGAGILGTIGAAIDSAIHGGDNGGAVAVDNSGGYNSGYDGGAQVIDFPLKSAYSPITNTGSPVVGMNVFWGDERGGVVNSGTTAVRGAQSMAGLGEDEPTYDVGELGTVTTVAPAAPIYAQGITLPNAGPSTLQSILNTIQTILPATISAVKGQPYYNTAAGNIGQFQTGLPVAANGQVIATPAAGAAIGSTAGAALGGIGDAIASIVANNPLLVLGGGLAVLLLFMESPKRGR